MTKLLDSMGWAPPLPRGDEARQNQSLHATQDRITKYLETEVRRRVNEAIRQIRDHSDTIPTKVPKSLFDANTVLKADTDDTPEAVTIPEDTVIGRQTAGDIDPITMAQLAAMLDGEFVVTTPFCFSPYIDQNSRQVSQNVHGSIRQLATGQALNSGATVTVEPGIGKLVIVLKAPGSGTPDYAGSIDVFGTTVDRNTGTETGGQTDSITTTVISADASASDANGVTEYDLTDAYITSVWFSGRNANPQLGDVVLSTTDLNCTVDVYQVSFEQLNDDTNAAVETLDLDAQINNTAAWLSAYLYHVDVSGDSVDITAITSIIVEGSTYDADSLMRLRRGNLATAIAGDVSGVVLTVALGPSPQSYWDDTTMKLWGTTRSTITVP